MKNRSKPDIKRPGPGQVLVYLVDLNGLEDDSAGILVVFALFQPLLVINDVPGHDLKAFAFSHLLQVGVVLTDEVVLAGIVVVKYLNFEAATPVTVTKL